MVRGTEPRLTNVTIDGITVPSPEPTVRQVRLDVMPADLVESVEVNKTLAPNMDGDGIGGSVNMKTKTAGEFPTITLHGLGGYNAILGGRANTETGGNARPSPGEKQETGHPLRRLFRLQRPRHRQLAARARPHFHFRQADLRQQHDSRISLLSQPLGLSPARPITNSAILPASISRASIPIFRITAISGITSR